MHIYGGNFRGDFLKGYVLGKVSRKKHPRRYVQIPFATGGKH